MGSNPKMEEKNVQKKVEEIIKVHDVGKETENKVKTAKSKYWKRERRVQS